LEKFGKWKKFPAFQLFWIKRKNLENGALHREGGQRKRPGIRAREGKLYV
jgi:hypothetical protein